MTHRERHNNIMSFKPVDRIPLVEWPIRGATMKAWTAQGYPEGTDPGAYFSWDPYCHGVPVNMFMRPMFEHKIIEINGEYKIWQDELGAVRKDFVTTANEGFVTRSWLSFPVSDKKSFEEMQKRYNPADPGRMPADFENVSDNLKNTKVNTHLAIPFLFWTVRDWVGFENLCIMFYDNPGLVKEMFAFVTDFCIETLKGKIDRLSVDTVELKEDMAYKHAPMISPAMFREFMYPHYERLVSFLKSNGVKFVMVDCDGFPGGLIPEWIDAGVDSMSPVEIAAENDLDMIQREYPRFGLYGGVDKRELAKDRRAVYEEVEKIPRRIERGGYIPHVDHAIPHDVPLANYIYYRELLASIASGGTLGEFKNI